MFIMLIKALVSVVIRNTLNISLVVLINTFINQSITHTENHMTLDDLHYHLRKKHN